MTYNCARTHTNMSLNLSIICTCNCNLYAKKQKLLVFIASSVHFTWKIKKETLKKRYVQVHFCLFVEMQAESHIPNKPGLSKTYVSYQVSWSVQQESVLKVVSRKATMVKLQLLYYISATNNYFKNIISAIVWSICYFTFSRL